ncbi:MAG: type II secretion system protein GspL [Pseudomonadota bacterium]
MSERVFVGMTPGDDTPVSCIVVDAAGAPRSRASDMPLQDIAALAGERPVEVVLHSMSVVRTQCMLPVSGSKLAQAMPYALEEQFAEDVDTLHFAASGADDDGTRLVAAIARSELEACLQRLSDADIVPRAVYSSHDALTPLTGFSQLLAVDDSIIVQGNDGTLAGFQGVSPLSIMEAWRASADATEDDEESGSDNVRIYADPSAHAAHSDDWARITQDFANADIRLLDDGWLAFAARALVNRDAINFLQGNYAASSNTLAVFKPWYLAAGLLGAALLLGLVTRFIDYRDLANQSAQLDQDIANYVGRVTGSKPTLSAAEQQLRALLGSRRGGSATSGGNTTSSRPFLETLRVVAEAVDADDSNTVDAFNYRNDVLDIRLTTSNAAALEALTKSIGEAGQLRAQIQRTEQLDDSVKSFVQVRPAAE